MHWSVFIRAQYARALTVLGRQRDASVELSRVVGGDFARLPRDFVHLATLVLIGETAIALGDRSVVDRVRRELSPYAGQLVTGGATFPLGSSWRYLGRLAAAAGDRQAARAALEAARDHDAAMGAWPSHAHDLVELAALTGDKKLAAEGRTRAEALGMSALVARAAALCGPAPPVSGSVVRVAELARSGEVWNLGLDGSGATLRDRRGLAYLARLVAEPGRAVHVLDLAEADVLVPGTPALDARAKTAYRERLDALRERAEEADRRGDAASAEAARAEIDALAAELARALGLGGRERRAGGTAERARAAVTLAIRRAIDSIADALPDLGEHLRVSIKTGAFCEYRPDPNAGIRWRVTT